MSTTEEDTLTQRARARTGQTLRQKWRLDRLLGVGGMAAVYAATHRNGARAAVKMLHLELSLDSEVKQRFLREGYAANAVGHPGVVRALDDDTADDGSVFLVLELLDGESLEDRRMRHGGVLPVDEALTVADALLDILETAHARGVIHRDLKPDNLFITRDGSLKLLDFGIARVREGAAQATRTGMTAGTPAFMAPEQALGRSSAIGPWTDLWSVGAVLFTLLTGRHVHEGESANEIMIKTATQAAPAIQSINPAVPAPVAMVIDQALLFESKSRWAGAPAMRTALTEARTAIGLGTAVLTPPPVTSSDSLPLSSGPGTETRFSGATTLAHGPLTTGGREAVRARWIGPGIGIGLSLLAVLGIVAVRSQSSEDTSTSQAAQASAVVTQTAATPSSTPSIVATIAAAQSMGQVRVRVNGGECTVQIAGKGQGATSQGRLDASAPTGKQLVQCDPGDGLALSESVTVRAGEATEVTFSLLQKQAEKTSKPTRPARPDADVVPKPPLPSQLPPANRAVDPMDRR